MDAVLFTKSALLPALSILPSAMNSMAAKTLVMAIGFQESAMKYRRQVHGPARGYFQFELGGGIRGVLNHASSKTHIRSVLAQLDYSPTATIGECYTWVEHNDILAVAFARLLLWTDPAAMPTTAQGGWDVYLRTWRPGKPHPEKWARSFTLASEVVAQCGR